MLLAFSQLLFAVVGPRLVCDWPHSRLLFHRSRSGRPDTSQRYCRRLPRCPLVFALMPFKCSSRNLIGCPLLRRKCLGALALSKAKHKGLRLCVNKVLRRTSNHMQPYSTPNSQTRAQSQDNDGLKIHVGSRVGNPINNLPTCAIHVQ